MVGAAAAAGDSRTTSNSRQARKGPPEKCGGPFHFYFIFLTNLLALQALLHCNLAALLHFNNAVDRFESR
jgi:hypothetical protein